MSIWILWSFTQLQVEMMYFCRAETWNSISRKVITYLSNASHILESCALAFLHTSSKCVRSFHPEAVSLFPSSTSWYRHQLNNSSGPASVYFKHTAKSLAKGGIHYLWRENLFLQQFICHNSPKSFPYWGGIAAKSVCYEVASLHFTCHLIHKFTQWPQQSSVPSVLFLYLLLGATKG